MTSDGDSDQTNRGEHDAQAIERVAAARGLPAAEGRGGPAAATVSWPRAPARPARGGRQPYHARVSPTRQWLPCIIQHII